MYNSGTPGVGKSTVCRQLSEVTGLTWLEVSRIAKENDCLSEYDEVYKCPVLDEDKVLYVIIFCMQFCTVKCFSVVRFNGGENVCWW